MNKQFIKNLKASAFVIVVSSLNPSFAAKVDLKQEINIDASRQAADLKNKIFSYIDNVVITQGSLMIKADLVQVITESDSEFKIYVAKGDPATFEQTLEDGTSIHLQASEIKYQPGQNTVVLTGNAELRQEGSHVSGSVISYNFLTEQVTANGNENDRVKTVLQPSQLDTKNK